MAGRKGKSGPPGNVNAAKSVELVMLKRQTLTAPQRQFLREYVASLLRDKHDPTGVERRTAECAGLARLGLMARLKSSEAGLPDQKFLGLELAALAKLGCERREDEYGWGATETPEGGQ